MRYRKLMFILVLTILIFGAASVCASDMNDTVVASDDDSAFELSQADAGDMISSDEDELIGQRENELINEGDNGTFAELQADINAAANASTLTLNKNYECEDGFDTEGILINKTITIDGNGFKIDAQGKSRIFKIPAENVILKNIIFINGNTDEYGGAVYFSRAGTVTNCNFVDNKAIGDYGYGGAICIERGAVTNCNFTGNSAGRGGGAIEMTYGTVGNCNFTDNTANEGGAFRSNSGNVSNCHFIDNAANVGGAVCFFNKGAVTNCNFVNNSANRGGAIYSYQQFSPADTCIFKANSGENVNTVILSPVLSVDNFTTVHGSGDKLTFDLKTNSSIPVTDGNISISVYFKDNNTWVGNYTCLSGDGWTVNLPVGSYYAIFNTEYDGFQPVNTTITITAPHHTFWFLDNIINGNDNPVIELSNDFYFDPDYDTAFIGGIEINRPVTINGNGHTLDGKGQACIFYVRGDNVTINNITFVNGKYGSNGGAIYWYGDNGTVSGSSFIGNNAGLYGGAIFWNGVNGNVSNSIFINNAANMEGDAIYGNRYLIADYCWFGGNATNYLDLPIAQAAYCNYILFLNATANPNEVPAFNTSEIVFKLYLYNKTSTTGDISEYDNTRLLPINLTITSTNGDVDIHTVNLGDSIRYTATGVGDASVTATIENVACTIALNNIMANLNLSVENQVVTYGENATIALNYIPNATGKVNITLTGKKGTFTYTNLDLNATIMLPKDIPADEYNVTVSYSGDVNFFNATANATLTVNKANSTLTINDNVTFDYNTNGSTTVSYTHATGVNASVVGQPNAIVVVNDTTITVSGLNAGNYTLTVTTITDKNHNNITKNATITVNKVNATLTVDDVVLYYGETKNVTVIVDGASAITAKIGESEVNVTGFVISIPALDAGTYILTVTAIADKNHNNITKNATITVNKLKTELMGNAITATYNVNKNLVITLKDSTGKALSGVSVIVDLNGAKTYITDSNGQVKVSTKGLAPKAYTAKVTFNGNTNYDKSTKDVKVTVKKATPKLTAKKKTFKRSVKVKKYRIVLKNNVGKAIKKAKVTIKIGKKTFKAKTNSKGKATFKIKKLTKKGNYNAKVSYKGSKYYNKVTKKVKIRIK